MYSYRSQIILRIFFFGSFFLHTSDITSMQKSAIVFLFSNGVFRICRIKETSGSVIIDFKEIQTIFSVEVFYWLKFFIKYVMPSAFLLFCIPQSPLFLFENPNDARDDTPETREHKKFFNHIYTCLSCRKKEFKKKSTILRNYIVEHKKKNKEYDKLLLSDHCGSCEVHSVYILAAFGKNILDEGKLEKIDISERVPLILSHMLTLVKESQFKDSLLKRQLRGSGSKKHFLNIPYKYYASDDSSHRSYDMLEEFKPFFTNAEYETFEKLVAPYFLPYDPSKF